MLETLLGRPLQVRDSEGPVELDHAAVVWSYVFSDGTLAAAGAVDLALAAVLGAGFGLLPPSRVADAAEAGSLAADVQENLQEVLNVLVNLYLSEGGKHVGLGRIWPKGHELPADVVQLLQCKTRRLDAAVRLPGYGDGLLSAVSAWSSPTRPRSDLSSPSRNGCSPMTASTEQVTDLETAVASMVRVAWDAFMLTAPEMGAAPTFDRDALVVSATVCLSGAWEGVLMAECEPATARRLCAELLSLEPADVEPEDVADTMAEVANVLGGNIKNVLPSPTLLSLPVVSTRLSFAVVRDAVELCRLPFTWDGDRLQIVVWGTRT